MRYGIFTGGGDVPGLNSTIKASVYRAADEGHEVIGLRRGWAGLLHLNPADPQTREQLVVPLTRANTRTIDRSGGTFLHTSRTNPGRVKEKDMPEHLRRPDRTYPADLTDVVVANLEHLQIDALIPIGGDDTLSYAARLHAAGYPQVAIPKTMDNDVYGTDFCIGFSTAVTRSVQAISDLRTAAKSDNKSAIEAKTRTLGDLSGKLAERLYSQAGGGPEGGAGGPHGGPGGPGGHGHKPADDGVVDAEFEEVKK